MRTSVINRFAKNDRAFSGRRRIAVLAATAVLAGGVQVLAMSDTAWACGDARFGTSPVFDPSVRKPTVPNSDFRDPLSNSLAADGSWTEFGVGMTNFTGADVAKAAPSFSLSGTSLRTRDVRVEVEQNGSWKPLELNAGCIGIDADTDSLAQPLANGRAADFVFRVSLSPASPKDLSTLTLVTDAVTDKATLEYWGNRTVKVTHPRTAPTTGKPTPAAKPAPAKPAPAEQTAAKQAAEKTEQPSAGSPAPQATPSAPAATAPAGTAELAHTGSSGTDTFLATSAAALLALGAGVLLVVRRLRRLRRQR
ncbi:hypothetical protein ACIG0C_01040 [Kitasatospora aureofaciens]|uniref:Gram-positive cocci surface proteins LPxTG domain-containing protein n=1 Tax=Kitasatospora aureofaciens TaxID=1894 RepID=A0A1E7NB72_KITAU|nr:hypothetical protein [Kitasatospora aureofaciens]ARF79496.1 hypothetical protein B6264_11735 [Kitasatospora aureofaciens]OEV37942.1 hypothetical protein HS99_0024060 [Kitasatospora aureofaciens]GGU65775.1 hypothetical protein GCM10010502_15880 [Kitasatospora aureofaciens]